jgi:predicted AlkP superfamily pyrophosphatase or phosphodiesterase
MRFLRLLALVALGLSSTASSEAAAGVNTRRVVIVVCDGMRPDAVTEKDTPTLWKIRREGVSFQKHHSVYPTATQVNGTAIAVGAYPGRSGLLANREYRPAILGEGAVDTAVTAVVRRGDELSEGKYLALPTIAETVRAAGRRAVVAGSKSIAFLHDRKAEWTMALQDETKTVFAATPMPPTRRAEVQRLLGPFLIRASDTNAARNAFTTRALTELLWRDGVPAFSLLWLSDPDLTQHETAPGSPEAIAAVRSSDRNLGTVLHALGKKNVRAETNVLAVSDHGFSTISRAVDIPELLRKAGFDALTTFTAPPRAGQIMVVGNGGSTLFYVIGRDAAITRRLVEWLQRSDFAGVIFSRQPMEGTFDLQTIHADLSEGPDVIVAMRWSEQRNRFGVAGEIVADAARSAGHGTHASLSKYDVHNALIASGPDFRRGAISQVPSGNIDLAPTVLHLLGIAPPEKFDGRVLSEAFTGGKEDLSLIRNESLEAKRDFGDKQWRQYLEISRVGGTTYFNQGNGALGAKPAPHHDGR